MPSCTILGGLIADGETVVWEISYTSSEPFGLFPAVTVATATFTNDSDARAALDADCLSGTTILADSHLIAGTVTIDGTDFTLSSIVMGRLEYDATSTYAGECIFLSADGHIQVNRLGSEDEYTN